MRVRKEEEGREWENEYQSQIETVDYSRAVSHEPVRERIQERIQEPVEYERPIAVQDNDYYQEVDDDMVESQIFVPSPEATPKLVEVEKVRSKKKINPFACKPKVSIGNLNGLEFGAKEAEVAQPLKRKQTDIKAFAAVKVIPRT